MCTSDFDERAPKDEILENTTSEPETPSSPDSDSVSTFKRTWDRRTFLKAAALGTAAVALFGRGSASAHIDTRSPCTAGDIDVSGGTIVNAPCECEGTFRAVAAFLVSNHNNAARNCITLHLDHDLDVLLFTEYDPVTDTFSGSTNISGLGTTQIMYGDLGHVPCDVEKLCYPQAVVAFKTAKNQQEFGVNCDEPLQKYPGGQCRRKEICVLGFGVEVKCADSSCAVTSQGDGPCSVPCGGTLYLRVVAAGSSSGNSSGQCSDPPAITLTGAGTITKTSDTVVDGERIACFSVTNASGTYTATATDCHDCTRTDTITVEAGEIDVELAISGDDACNDGVLTFTATAKDPDTGQTLSGCSFDFKLDGQDALAADVSGNVLTYRPKLVNGALDTASHTVSVIANCDGCEDCAQRTVSQCINSTVGDSAACSSG